MKRLTMMTLCLCISLIPSLHSQSQQSLFLQYPSDVHALDDDQRSMLSDLLVKLESHADYDIEIIGHTDQDGTNEYNEVLAQKRAEVVNEHLLTMGVAEDLIYCSWKGETALIERDDSQSSKQKNRRVELRYSYRDFDKIDELINAVSTNGGEQKFQSDNQEQTIDLEKGSSLYIPEGAFIHQDGSEVNGKVDVTVIEAYDLHDFVSHDLITECKD